MFHCSLKQYQQLWISFWKANENQTVMYTSSTIMNFILEGKWFFIETKWLCIIILPDFNERFLVAKAQLNTCTCALSVRPSKNWISPCLHPFTCIYMHLCTCAYMCLHAFTCVYMCPLHPHCNARNVPSVCIPFLSGSVPSPSVCIPFLYVCIPFPSVSISFLSVSIPLHPLHPFTWFYTLLHAFTCL